MQCLTPAYIIPSFIVKVKAFLSKKKMIKDMKFILDTFGTLSALYRL